MKVGFIGFGRMGQALAFGAVSSHVLSKSSVRISDPNATHRSKAKRLGIKSTSDNLDVVKKSEIVFLCVKPQAMMTALREIKKLPASMLRTTCFVSIAAGVTLDSIRKALGTNVPLVRVMPNTPALARVGMSAVSFRAGVSPWQRRAITKILSSVSAVVNVKEAQMDAITAVSGSGPAYVFYLAEAMEEAARSMGLGSTLAQILVRQTIFGSGVLLQSSIHGAKELRRQVTSPGGTTEAALKLMEKRRVRAIMKQALQRARARSKTLSGLIR